MSTPPEWTSLLEELHDYVTPDWMSHAEKHGDQAWVRLVLLVDVQNLLMNPFATEKVAGTMADLAVNRPEERKGWELIGEEKKKEREALVTAVFDAAENVLPPELLHLFVRAAEPSRVMMGGAP
jgi:hypothetical protein